MYQSVCITDLLAIDELHSLNILKLKATQMLRLHCKHLLLPYHCSTVLICRNILRNCHAKPCQASASRKISSKDGQGGASFSAPSLPCHSDMSCCALGLQGSEARQSYVHMSQILSPMLPNRTSLFNLKTEIGEVHNHA